MRIVVFGAGGFVGGWISEEAGLRPEIDLVACVRRWASAVRLARRGLKIVQADLAGFNQLAPLLARADAVINATLPPPAEEADLVARLYEECARAGVRRFVHLSSIAVYGDRAGDIDETVAPVPSDDYGRGKAATETRLMEIAGHGRPQVIILRPSIIYGPFSETWTVRYAQRIQRGRWKSIGAAGIGTCNLVHAHDVARAALAAAQTSNQSPLVLNINGPDIVTWNEYIERFGDALEIANRQIPSDLSFRTMTAATALARGAGQWAKRRLKSLAMGIYLSPGAAGTMIKDTYSLTKLYPSLGEARLLRRKALYRWQKATAEIGLEPRVRLEEGLKQSAQWCRRHGVV
jgi:nucleoside-diphosphate-sugar epimerase